MPYLEENEWMLINELTYNVHYIYLIEELQNMFLNLIKILINYDVAIFARIKKESDHPLLYGIQYSGIDKKMIETWREATLLSDYTRWIIISGKNRVFRESDMQSEKTIRDSVIYQKFYKPLRLFHSMGICFVFKETPLALLRFYRKDGDKDFSTKELFILDQIHNHMAYRLSYEVNKGDTRYFWAKSQFMMICQEKHLTEKEAEIFNYAIKGLANNEICSTMNITLSTVKKHLNSLYAKLGVKNRVQLLQYLPPSTNKINYDE
jgi:DNA-binding CsgD family transcriptional regulator